MKYFTIAELVRSDTANRMGINNSLPKDLLPNAQALIQNVLDPLREAYGKPIVVTSGYRCEALKNRKLFYQIQSLELPFDQLIWEKGTSDGPDWVHVSYRGEKENRRQVLAL